MRILAIALALVASVSSGPAQSPAPADLLNQMRDALGGAAALDAVKSLSAGGDVRNTMAGFSRQLTHELHVLVPDRFLRVQRDAVQGPIATTIVYYNGFNGDNLIRRTDAPGMQFPPDPIPDQSPAGIARWRTGLIARQKQELSKLWLAFFGTSLRSYPLDYAYSGSEVVDGAQQHVIEAKGADGFTMRLYVDALTHLPTAITWRGERAVMMKTTSVVTTRGGEVVSRSPESAPVPVGPSTTADVEYRWTLSQFKSQDGLNWPRKIKVTGGDLTEEISIRSIEINPAIDPRKFDIK